MKFGGLALGLALLAGCSRPPTCRYDNFNADQLAFERVVRLVSKCGVRGEVRARDDYRSFSTVKGDPACRAMISRLLREHDVAWILVGGGPEPAPIYTIDFVLQAFRTLEEVVYAGDPFSVALERNPGLRQDYKDLGAPDGRWRYRCERVY